MPVSFSRRSVSRTSGVSPTNGCCTSSGVAGMSRRPTQSKPPSTAHDTISGGLSSSTVNAARLIGCAKAFRFGGSMQRRKFRHKEDRRLYRARSRLPAHHPEVWLSNHLICAYQQRLRKRETERIRGLEIDHELELGRLFHGKLAGLRALEDLVDVFGETAITLVDDRPVGHQVA